MKPTQKKLYAEAGAVIAAMDLSELFGDAIFDATCEDEAAQGLMADVQRDIADRVRRMRLSRKAKS